MPLARPFVSALSVVLVAALAGAASAAPRGRAPHPAFARAAAVSAAPGAPTARQSVPDGSGGMFVSWEDFRDGALDVRLLRVTSAGAVAAGWPGDGVAVCTAPGDQYLSRLLSDGAGGVIVAWLDARSSRTAFDVYAQRVNAGGSVQWTANGVLVAQGVGSPPELSPDGSGGLLLAWTQTDLLLGTDVLANRIGSGGSVPTGWSTAGIAVSDAMLDKTATAVVADGAGGAYVLFEVQDPSTQAWAQRLDAGAAPLWTSGGQRVDASATGVNTSTACGDGSGGLIAYWSDGSGVAGQRLDGAGAAQWGASGSTVGSALGYVANDLVAVPGGSGASFLSWSRSSPGGLVAQAVNASGARQWGTSGVSVVTNAGMSFPTLGAIFPDGSGGAIHVFEDERSNDFLTEIYAQRISSGGVVQWTADGVALVTGPGDPVSAVAAADGAGGVIAAWTDARSGAIDLYGQRLNGSGAAQWTANGQVIYGDPLPQVGGETLPDGSGGAWVFWQERVGGRFDIRARRLNASGAPVTGTVVVCDAPGFKTLDSAIPDGSGGFIALWEDHRAGGGEIDVYAQRVNDQGNTLWAANGVALSTAVGEQIDVDGVSDGLGGVLAVWNDYSNVGNGDIRAQRLDSAGAAQWGASGVNVCNALENQSSLEVASDGAGGVIVFWFDQRSFLDFAIYAQRLNGSGVAQWTANGVNVQSLGFEFATLEEAVNDGSSGAVVLVNSTVFPFGPRPAGFGGVALANRLWAQRVNGSGAAQWGATGTTVCDAAAEVHSPRLVTSGSGSFIAAWSDGRAGTWDVYGQRFTTTGAMQWVSNGVALCSATGWQEMAGLAPDGAGGILLSWADARGGGFYDTYAQRVGSDGSAAWTANGVAVCTAARGQYSGGICSDGAGGGIVGWTDNRLGNARHVYAQRIGSGGVPQWNVDGVTSVTATLASASVQPGRAELVWRVSASGPVQVQRAAPGEGWITVGEVLPDGDGFVAWSEDGLETSGRYGWRLAVVERGEESLAGEVWLDVPTTLALAMHAPRPNPIEGDLVVSFTLPGDAPARVDVLDAAGRRVGGRDVTALGAGRHTLRLGAAPRAAGVYFLRVTQDGRSATARAIVVK